MTLLTGASGVVGRHLKERFTEFSYRDYLAANHVLPKSLEREESLVHLAGIVGEENVRKNQDASSLANVTGVAKLANDFFSGGGQVFYFASSGHVYGGTSRTGALEHDTPYPRTVYAEQKLSAENSLRAISENTGKKVVVLRIFSVLGDEMPENSLLGAIRRGIRGEMKIQNPDDLRDFLSPRQVAHVIHGLTRKSTENNFEVVNLCTGRPTSIRRAAKRIAAMDGHTLPLNAFEGSQSSMPVLIGNPTKLSEVFGAKELRWEPAR